MSTSATAEETVPPPYLKPILASLALFGVWMAGTWLMEGRLETLLHPEDVTGRFAYALFVNLIVGIGGSAWLLRRWLIDGVVDAHRSGVEVGVKTPVAIIAGFALGGGLYALQGAPSWEPIVLINAFAQTLIVSIAEVMVCWVLIGNLVRETLDDELHYIAPITGAVVASLLFGLYHFAHSPPFNTWSMVGLLIVVGFLTSAFYFFARDIWGTVAFHNMLAVFGVVSALAERDALASYQTLSPQLIGAALIGIFVLIPVQVWIRKTMPENGH